MEKLLFDSGIKTYKVGAGVLKFNPTDPNLYARFLEVLEELTILEKAIPLGDNAVAALAQTDKEVKARLSYVFGPGNDVDAVFGGVSLLAVGASGERLITNFMAVIEPILSDGARACAAAEAKDL